MNFTLDDLPYIIVEKNSDIVEAVSLIGSFSISEMEKGMLIQNVFCSKFIKSQRVQIDQLWVLARGRGWYGRFFCQNGGSAFFSQA
ncbi:MAG: hypothetical protein R6V72_19060 [Cyclobacterium sp.]|uniref:hypothetical protein n=1 Tax=unclassified Cyclobacterium TaxID=2615055 RepID=UPI0013D60815|nr:hypothetical protein [Cyclobacterium sp. SYSU L10401]